MQKWELVSILRIGAEIGLLSLCLFGSFLLFHPTPAAVGFVSEDEYLEIQGITRSSQGTTSAAPPTTWRPPGAESQGHREL